jgi:hypothetical protein
VQGLELTVRIPPAVSEFSEFVQFGRVGVDVEHDSAWKVSFKTIKEKALPKQGF